MPATLWRDIQGALWSAAFILVRVGLGALVWTLARRVAASYRRNPDGKKWWAAYGWPIVLCAWLGASVAVGHPDDDYLPGEGSPERRGLTTFFATAVIALHGTWRGRHPKPEAEDQSD
jgi:hypothetical protein